MGPVEHGSDTETQHRDVVIGGGTMTIGDGNSAQAIFMIQNDLRVFRALRSSMIGATSRTEWLYM